MAVGGLLNQARRLRTKLLRGQEEAGFGDEKERVQFFWSIFQGERPLSDMDQLPEGCRERDVLEKMVFSLAHGRLRESLGLKSHATDVFNAWFQHKAVEGPWMDWEEFKEWWHEERQYQLPDLDIDVMRELLAQKVETSESNGTEENGSIAFASEPGENSVRVTNAVFVPEPAESAEDQRRRAELEQKIRALKEQLGEVP